MKSLYRTFRAAVHALRRNIGRSLLTCLGIILGIASVIAMAEIGQGASSLNRERVASMGANLINVDPDSSASRGISSGASTGATLTPQDCDAIRKECSAVRWAAPSVDSRAQIIAGNKNWNPDHVKGTTPDYLLVRNWQVEYGAAFTDADVRRAAPVCLLGQTIASALFGSPEAALGQSVRMKNIPIKVIGVLGRKGASSTGRDQDDILLAPWTMIKYRLSGSKMAFEGDSSTAVQTKTNTLSELYPGQEQPLYPAVSAIQTADTPYLIRFNDLDDIYLSAVSPDQIQLAIRQITQVLRERHRLGPDDPDDFRIRDATAFGEVLNSTTNLVTELLLSVALISLIVGGVGIMNIMLVSVTERTREIGLRMAVGARARDILGQFLTEALLLCLAGGIVGILMGRGASEAITAILHWPTMSSLPALLAAVGTSATVGLIFGYYPAWKASRLDPIEALRYE
jgi:ABC-type antimicrobial peptide transport system permease subunit